MLFNLQSFGQRKYKFFSTKDGKEVSMEEMVKMTKKYDVIFFGEYHDDTLIHKLQKEYLEAFYKVEKKTAVSMEMFERDVQPVMNDYLAGKISYDEFFKKSRPWGPSYELFYKPLVELAKQYKAPVVASNVPRPLANLCSSGGIAAINNLPPADRANVAKNINVVRDNYMKDFYNVMLANMGMDFQYEEVEKKLPSNQQNTLYLMYCSQTVKDETMGESIYLLLQNNKDIKKVIHFDGDFHSAKRQGTVQKVQDRNPKLKIGVIKPVYSDKMEYNAEYKVEGDFIIVCENKPREPEAMPTKGMPSSMGSRMQGNFINEHNIKINIDPQNNYLEGTDVVKFKAPVGITASLGILKDLEITNVTANGGKFEWKAIKDSTAYQEILINVSSGEISEFTVSYKGKIYNSPSERALNVGHSYSLGFISNKDKEGIYLPAASFYPTTEKDFGNWSLRVTCPKDFEMISSGTMTKETKDNTNIFYFKTEMPTGDLDLLGGKYFRLDTTINGKTFGVYTFENSNFSRVYMNAIIDYYNKYTKLFGPYPFSRFSVVESSFDSGFGMPGFTLLTGKLIKMPNILLAPGSLAHEFCHNWWGNSIYGSERGGNWGEALTTFSANYYYNVMTNEPAKTFDWRRKALLEINNLPAKFNYPVMNFKYQRVEEDAVIGYQKGAFVFYEVYKLMGDKPFFEAIADFASKNKGKKASWKDLIDAFTTSAKNNNIDIPVMNVVMQWISTKDIPELSIANVKEENNTVAFQLNQNLKYFVSVPVKIVSAKAITKKVGKKTITSDSLVTVMKSFVITDSVNNFTSPIIGKLKSIEIDPEYQVLRKTNKWDVAFGFDQTMIDNPLIIVPAKTNADYAKAMKVVDMLKQTGAKVDTKSFDEVNDKELAEKSILLLGNTESNPMIAKLTLGLVDSLTLKGNVVKYKKNEYTMDGCAMVVNNANPKNADKYLSIIYFSSKDEAVNMMRLKRYSNNSLTMISEKVKGKTVLTDKIFPKQTGNNPLLYKVK